jgi:methylmalonyl-CoA mutase cobalamin-binding subunit
MNKPKKNIKPVFIGGAIGNCVHVAGVYDFLRIAESMGFTTVFLGAAVEPEVFVEKIIEHNAGIVCVSYRLTPDALNSILDKFFKEISKNNLNNLTFYFGGTPKAIEVARKYPLFTEFFAGEENLNSTINLLSQYRDEPKGIENTVSFTAGTERRSISGTANEISYLPLIRHHFGLPTLNDTISGIEKISEFGLVDVISIATDQNAQEFFFEPHKMDHNLDGTGGVPVRSEADMEALFAASQRGSFPRLRVYSGTKNLIQWAEMSVRTIDNAWGTIPLFWYSQLDGRSKRPLHEAIEENKKVMKWYADRDIPVEINDSHHWSLRESSDVTAVVDYYLSALNAKKLGVKKYIAQMMFNTPRLTTPTMDLAKMLAKDELISELKDENFTYLKQVRAGLTHFSLDMNVAKGQLAASTLLSLALKPDIIHVVSFTEANHAATPEDVIESCGIVKGVLKNTWKGMPDLTLDPEVKQRKDILLKEARKMIEILKNTYSSFSEDPLTDSVCLGKMVYDGFLDAPQLRGNPAALGKVKTMPINGAYDIVDEYGKVISHEEYFSKFLNK